MFLLTLTPALLFASDFPKPTGPVNDFAGVIDAQNKESLTLLLTELEEQTSIAMVIATVPSLNGSDIETYSVKLFQDWGIGKKGIDKGLLILAAIKDRNARIEVGYGLEPYLPDAFAGRILREVLFPYFKEWRYGDGFSEASFAIISQLENKLGFKLKTAATFNQPRASLPWPLTLIFFLIFAYLFIRHPLLFLFFLSGGGRSAGGGFRGGGFGGGFGGFGGGLSGGGGASGRW